MEPDCTVQLGPTTPEPARTLSGGNTMQSRHESTTQHRNRTTGFSDADWGVLEKRLSDTRDLLRDILSHLRQVLDNLKSAGAHYQSPGRAWRKTDSCADDYRRQPGHRQNGPTAGAYKSQGAAGPRFQSSNAQSANSSSSSSASSRQTTFGKSAFDKSTFGKSKTDEHSASGAFSKSAQDRQAGTGFSWSSRTKTETSSSASSASGKAEASGQQKTSSRDWRTQRESSGTAGNQGKDQAGSHQQRQEHRHRTTGPGGGSSYQEYKQRSNKSPLGHARMTLTQACALLCITYPCTADDIKAAYRKQARRHHPDLGGDEEMMKSINQAYELALSWCSPLRGKPSTWAA